MGCNSCSGGSGCSPKGCGNNGTCGTGGCNKLNVFDWFSDMEFPADHKPFNIVEVRFKGSRKEYYRNEANLELFTGDPVVVQAETGNDVGHVSLSGELVRLQLKKHHIDEDNPQIFKIYRKATEKDLEKYSHLKQIEPKTLERARTIAMELKLSMKLSDIEFQGDGKKVIFFYTAEERVDFRELIKKYAEEFRVRIEMKQIGYRQEAARLGGIGSCGRELCCSTWLTDFKVVNTSAARYQNLSINMLKLSGQCGRLKCCLNYELDTYMEALQDFPKTENLALETESGRALSQKVDILKRTMWFSYGPHSEWIPVGIDQVNEILKLNQAGQKGKDLYDTQKGSLAMQRSLDAEDIISENSLTRMDDKDRKKKKKKKKKPQSSSGKPAGAAKAQAPSRPSGSGRQSSPNKPKNG